ncbi:MAG TPA: Crp/Fnr family transcriptional regulator, partial [Burkholderiaceae bacterium]|nr:Crp/Fnr family transcriptional regulator [Burkholderiaceae bacterium]
GTILFRQGDPCVGFHNVVYGRAKLMLRSPVGDEKVVRIIGAGDSFGEALMFMGKPYIVTAQVLEDSMLLHIGRDGLLALLDARPQLSRKMLASLSQRLHKLMSDVESYSLRSGTQRVIGYLIKGDTPDDTATDITLPASKAVIASRLNLTPEHFSRILRDLSEQKLIHVQGRVITILNSEALRRYEG